MENLGLSGWRGRKVFLTGHTGFKGSWLLFWLQRLGADVHGYALSAEPGSIYDASNFDTGEISAPADVRDILVLTSRIRAFNPDIVIHMAAQSLVQKSYIDPIATYETNVIGTANLLNACRELENLESILVVTSDKCYLNKDEGRAFEEDDELGGRDPYSSSKAMQEMVVNTFWRSYYRDTRVKLATARAGNVIGGGDVCSDRLVPDYFRAAQASASLNLRNPNATRPWQHVLEPLYGYIRLLQFMDEQPPGYFDSFNFGPQLESVCSVSELVTRLNEINDPKVRIVEAGGDFAYEAQRLALSIDKAKRLLDWQPVLSLNDALHLCVEYVSQSVEHPPQDIINAQIDSFGVLTVA